MNLVLRERIKVESLEETIAGELFLPTNVEPCPAVVVCHGAGEFKENYIELCEHLARSGVGSAAIDMHGHGESGGKRGYVQMREWVADIRATLDAIEKDRRIDGSRLGAFGLSSGGTAILEAAVQDSRLRALVALDATVRDSMPRPLSLCLKAMVLCGRIKRYFTGEDLRVDLLKLGGGMPFASDAEINAKLLNSVEGTAAFRSFPFPGAAESFFVDTLKRVGSITASTMVIWGEDDQVDPPESGRLLHQALTCRKSLEIIGGNGHVGHLDRNRQRVFDLTAHWFSENLSASTVSYPEAPAACQAG